MTYTVVLQHPEYACEDAQQAEHSSWHVEGSTVKEACRKAQYEAANVLVEMGELDWNEDLHRHVDFIPVFVATGWHKNCVMEYDD